MSSTPHQVIPRKYRPKTFEELVGQETTARCFLSMIQRNVLPHAILLCGTRGVGKTSAARIFAKALHCRTRKNTGDPCGVCSECQQIEVGRHLDVLEIDGASNNGVDAVRELRETAYYLPTQGKHKIYIIDEVHMLSTSAFNALLKILEEPPPHLIFVFATTEPTELPTTILSRVMRLDFHPIKTPILADHLAKVSKAEGRSITPVALNKIAALGTGSMRDAQMLLEQVFMYYAPTQTIDENEVRELFSLVNQDTIYKLLEYVGSENTSAALTLLATLHQEGHDPSTLALEIQRGLRHILLTRCAPKVIEVELSYAPAQIQTLKFLVTLPAFSEDALLVMFQALIKTYQVLRYGEYPQWVLEACVIQLSQVRRWMGSPTKVIVPPVHVALPSQKTLEPSHTQAAASSPPPLPEGDSTFLQFLLKKDPFLYGLLQSCRVQITADHIQIYKGNNAFTFEKLKDKRNLTRLTQVCQNSPFEGKKVVLFEATSETTSPASLQPDLKERRERLVNHPVVKTIKRELGAEVTQVIENQSILSTDENGG